MLRKHPILGLVSDQNYVRCQIKVCHVTETPQLSQPVAFKFQNRVSMAPESTIDNYPNQPRLISFLYGARIGQGPP